MEQDMTDHTRSDAANRSLQGNRLDGSDGAATDDKLETNSRGLQNARMDPDQSHTQDTLDQNETSAYASPRKQADNNEDEPDDEGNRKIVPPDTDNDATNTGGSMSEGNLSNSRYGRERTQAVHEKTFITGSDSDGQVS